MLGASKFTVILLFLTYVSYFNADAIQSRIDAVLKSSQRIKRNVNDKRVAPIPKLHLSKKNIDDLTVMFGSREAGIKFANDFSRYVRVVKKDLTPDSSMFFWLLKKIIYAYYRAFMLLWGVVPADTKKEIIKFVISSPFLRSLIMKLLPYLPEMAFGSLGTVLGLGGSLLG